MKSWILSLALTLSAVPAMASLTGNWIGWGTWSYQNENDGVKCDTMQMAWTETDTSLVLEKGSYDCGVVGMEIDQIKWTRQGQNILDENQNVVGQYDGTDLKMTLAGPNPTTKINVSLHQEAGHFDYREVWYTDKEKIYIIKGRLFKHQ